MSMVETSARPETTVEIVLPRYDRHPKQQLLVESPAKRKVIRAGRRAGKTTGAAILAVDRFLAGRRVLYATPTSDQIKKFWLEVCLALEEPIRQGIFQKNETEHFIVRNHGFPHSEQRIRAKTAWNADTLRGDYADLLILDEWQLMNEDAWEQVGAPMLMDNNGDAVFIYTPPSLHSRSVTKARDLQHARKLFRKAQGDKTGRWLALHFTSHDNPYLSQEGLAEVAGDMTRLAYRQEILAEDIDEVPGALWKQALIESTRVVHYPPLERIVVGIDPSGSSSNEAGVVAAGRSADRQVYVLRDASLLAPSPKAWATAAISVYHELEADRIIGERNYGGDMVESTVHTVDANVAYKDVNAARGKLVRAEPVCALYEQGIVHHVGVFPQLEEEMCSYVPGNPSPNRMDALVWTVIELTTGGHGLIDFWTQQMKEEKEKKGQQLPPSAKELAMQPQDQKDEMFNRVQQVKSLGKVATSEQMMVCPNPKCGNKFLQRFGGSHVSDPGRWKCNLCGMSGQDQVK